MEKKLWRIPQGQRQHSEVSVLRAFITFRGLLLIEEKTYWMEKQNDNSCNNVTNVYVVVQFYPRF